MVAVRDVERYIGRSYEPGVFDCADLAVLVQLELFQKSIPLPAGRARRHAQVAAIEHYRGELGIRIRLGDARDGDVVLMKGESLHIGTMFLLGGCWRVLHNSRALGGVWLHKLSDLPAYGLLIEGFYRWK